MYYCIGPRSMSLSANKSLEAASLKSEHRDRKRRRCSLQSKKVDNENVENIESVKYVENVENVESVEKFENVDNIDEEKS